MRFAIVGCGAIAMTHAHAIARLDGEASLVACCDEVPGRAARFASRFGVEAMTLDNVLADRRVEAVAVCTPSGLHAAVGVPALSAGKHVLVEKPMDVTLEACDALLAAQAAYGATLGVVSQRRFDAAARRVKEAVADGCLGRVVLTECQVAWFRTQEYYDSGDWRGTWGLDGGGCLMNQGLHSVDLLRWICGPVDSVYAQARTATHERIEVEDTLCATLVFRSGALGTLLAATSAYPGRPARIAVHGTAGGAVIEGDALSLLAPIEGPPVPHEAPNKHALLVSTGGTKAATQAAREATGAQNTDEDWTDGHVRQLRDFVRAARRGSPPLIDGLEGRRAVELVLAIYESAAAGEVVRL